MRYLFFFLLFAPFFFGFTKPTEKIKHSPVRVAILDTGLDTQDPRFKDLLCPEIGQDFTGEGLKDTYGHGTHIAGLIKEYAADKNYCLIILKFYSEKDSPSTNTKHYLHAIDALYKFHPDVVNISSDGGGALPQEKTVIANLTNVKFFVAAGNDHQDLDKLCNVYPACFAKDLKNVTVVGNATDSQHSNYGKIVGLWLPGTGIGSTYPFSLSPIGRGVLSGTSMSTAMATGEYVYEHY